MADKMRRQGRPGLSKPARPVILLALGLLLLPLPAQEKGLNGGGIGLADLAPRDIFAYLSFAGLKESSQAAGELGLYKLWREKEVQHFFHQVVERFDGMAARIPAEAKENWEKGKTLLGGRVSLILGGLTVVWQREQPILLPGMVLALDVGGHKEQFRGALAEILASEQVKREFRGVVRSTWRHGATEVMEFKQVRWYPQLSLCAAFVEDLFLVGLNRGLLCRCIDNLGGTGKAALAGLPAFRRARSKNPGKPLMEMFLNVDGFTSRLRGLVPDEWLAVLHTLGLDGIQGVYFSSAVRDGDSRELLYLDAPAPRRGLLHMDKARVRPETLALIPADAAAFEVGRVDLAGIWDTLWEAMDQVLPPGIQVKLKKGLAQGEKQLGLKVRGEILGALGQEYLVYAQLRKHSLFPSLVASMEVKDRAKMEKILQVLFHMSGLQARQVNFKGHEMNVITLPEETPFSPTYAFLSGRFMISLTPMGIKEVIRGLDRKGKDIRSNENFCEVFHGMNWENASLVRFMDMKRAAAFGYSLAETFLPALKVPPGFPLDLSMLPDQELVLRHLKGWGDVGTCDRDGLILQGRATGVATLLGLAARFLDRAPGIPPLVLAEIAKGFAPRRSAQPNRRRTTVRQLPARPAAPAGGGEFVNPLRPGDPQEEVWRRQEKTLTQAIAKEPARGELYFQRGHARHRLRHYQEAVADFRVAYDGGFNKILSAYNICCCLSLAGRKDLALEWFQRACEEGYRPRGPLNDPDLKNIRQDPRFRAICRKHGIR